MATQVAIQVTKYDQKNPAAGLAVAELPRPTPGPGEALVQLKLRPVNPADIFSIIGVYPGWRPPTLPAVPGLEGLGVVVENGPGASKFAPGQRVVGAPYPSVAGGHGTWAQFLAVPEASLAAVPDAVSDEAAAQFWINPVTVVGLLDVLQVPKGEWLLQTAAGSVLGRQLIQLAKARGIRTINLVRRRELEGELKALGADEVVVSTEGDWVAAVKQLTDSRGAWASVDAVSGETLGGVLSATRAGGTAVAYGTMDGVGIKVVAEVMELLERGVITPYAGVKYPLEQAAEAVAHAATAARGGKVLLEG
eukprot:scaffold9.g3043.t1